MNKEKLKNYLPYVPLGAAAGFVNGFLGTGGGIILIFGAVLIRRIKKEPPVDARDCFAQTAAVTVIFSVISAFFYADKGGLPFRDSLVYAVPALFGGFLGAYLLDRLPVGVLKKIFAAVVVVAGVIMVLR